MARKRTRLRGKTIATRLTGISTPIGGISWKPPVDEQDKAKRLLTFLEDRRTLYHPYDMEVGDYVVQSILEIRERLTADLEDVSKSSILGESLTAMRSACRKFLDEVQKPRGRRYLLGPHFISCLGELRALFGIHVARLACAYDLELENDLASILPPEPDERASISRASRKKKSS
ncbi:MAG: hypothetical protein GTO12_09390 [Proteobacteria bacterium]|nr:hypothetical protein [Pseudomonadota bacterium]